MQPLGHDDPRRIGDYRLLGVLGAGGMGRVYLGRNAGGRTVAVKVIRPDLITDPEFRARFQREVAAARRVGGSCTAPVLDADVHADPPWLATGYVSGLALSDAVERFGPLGEHSLIVLARGLAEALIAVHEAGVVHRDLKPSNVLLAVDGPKVIDFGIARAVEDTALTTTGKVIGSPAFMCPEQVTGETVGPAGDVFALGGVLAYAATGQGPFGGGDTVQLLFRIVYEQPRLDAVPEPLRALMAACLAKNPADRPSPRQVLERLDGPGAHDRTGWLPAPVLEDVSRRAVLLLDLDSGPADHPLQHRAGAPQPLGYVHEALPVTGQPTTTVGSDPGIPTARSRPDAGYPAAPDRWAADPGFRRTAPTAVHTPAESWPDATPPGRPTPEFDRTASARRGGRGPLIAALVVIAAAVAAGAFFIGIQLRDDQPGDTIASPSTTAPPATTPPPTTVTTVTDTTTTTDSATATADSSVPADFVGTWRGTAADGLVAFDIELTIEDGGIGAEIARSSNTGKLTGHYCSRIERLTDVTDGQLTFVARLGPDTAAGCADDGSVSTVRLQPDGSLAYSTPGVFGGEISGTLRRG